MTDAIKAHLDKLDQMVIPDGDQQRQVDSLIAALKCAVETLERYELAAFDVKGEIFSVGSVAREALADITKILEAKT